MGKKSKLGRLFSTINHWGQKYWYIWLVWDIVKIIVILILAYFVYKEGWPFMLKIFGGG